LPVGYSPREDGMMTATARARNGQNDGLV
jgi:hypothetical protein